MCVFALIPTRRVTDKETFARVFPALARRGFTHMYQFVGLKASEYGPEGARIAWAYRIKSVAWILNLPKHKVYNDLVEALEGKNTFSITSNVDLFVEKHGFDKSLIWTPQGVWRYIQCLKPCRSDAVFEAQPFIDRILPLIDDETMLIPESAIPRCPHCGGDMSFNVRGGDWFIEERYRAQQQRFAQWLASPAIRDGKLVVLDIGRCVLVFWFAVLCPLCLTLNQTKKRLQHADSGALSRRAGRALASQQHVCARQPIPPDAARRSRWTRLLVGRFDGRLYERPQSSQVAC